MTPVQGVWAPIMLPIAHVDTIRRTRHRSPRNETFDSTLWNKVHAMGQLMFDTIRDVADTIDRNEPIHRDVASRVKEMTSCGFCAHPMDVYRTKNQVFLRFGSCGHLFHAEANDLRLHRACYSRYIDAKKRESNVCLHCRRHSMDAQTQPKRRRVSPEVHAEPEPVRQAEERTVSTSSSLSHISETDDEETGQL